MDKTDARQENKVFTCSIRLSDWPASVVKRDPVSIHHQDEAIGKIERFCHKVYNVLITWFCGYSVLEKCVKKLIKLFYPRLILSISDELPEGANEDCIKKVRWVSDYCRTYYNEEKN